MNDYEIVRHAKDTIQADLDRELLRAIGRAVLPQEQADRFDAEYSQITSWALTRAQEIEKG